MMVRTSNLLSLLILLLIICCVIPTVLLASIAATDDDTLPPDQWFTQLLDHANSTDKTTWQQKYQVISEYYETGGPAFVMISGEGEASSKWMAKSYWVNYGKKFKALMFQVEHRFYGESHPTSDASTENLKYLTSEQALADIAYFVEQMTQSYSLAAETKWIAFGDSYSGNLAAWVRLLYPDLIHGAMAASAPVLAKVDFSEYVDIIEESLGTYGEDCPAAVRSAHQLLNTFIESASGREELKNLFNLCDSINASNQNDIYKLHSSLATQISVTVQSNKNNNAFISSIWNITIDVVCDIMTNQSLGTPLERYAAVNALFGGGDADDCLDYKYSSVIEYMANTSWDGADGGRQWMYQQCTEFGFFQTSESEQQIFGNNLPLEFYLQHCSDIFGFTEEVVRDGVTRTNILYGGLDLNATRVVYVHGSIDPWHALGITQTRLVESPAIYINGTSHSAIMYPAADTDLPALTEARERVGELIEQWLLEDFEECT